MKQSVAKFNSNRDELEDRPKDLGPFAKSAENLWRAGLTPIPVGGEDGKKPLVIRFTKWKSPPGLNTIRKWIEKYPNDNIGIVTGRLSGISVIDIDSADPTIQRAMIKRFGDTPLKTRTPSGGCHLWYRHNGEASADLSPDLPVQIKAYGGIVVVPPSVRPSDIHAGHRYEFIEGSLDDLVRLPFIKLRSTERVVVQTINPTRLQINGEGRRNNSLFRHLKDNAPHCDDIEALLDVGMTFGQHDCDPPLPLAEIIKTVDSVWKMMEEGRLWAKGAEPRVIVSGTAIDALSSDALKLLLKLQLSHFDRFQFALSAKAMAEAQVIPGWSHHKYRIARTEIQNKGYLKMLHEGGSRPGDPSLFGFASPLAVMGTKSVPNITIHPPPGRSPARALPQREQPVVIAVADQRQLDLFEYLGEPPSRRVVDVIKFGALVREARQMKGLTQQQAARLTGLSRSALGNIETAAYLPGPAATARLINGLELLPLVS